MYTTVARRPWRVHDAGRSSVIAATIGEWVAVAAGHMC